MCLAVPGKVVSIDQRADPHTGLIDFGGVQKQACLEYLPDVQVGEYVIVHVGFAL
ncbi:HypC/HybG/HupF family hydrogenase formation chaperone, partial [Streptomyces sp. SID2955]|nr:HypC/HybG/HupF family hydrogenase formation chaperone [Streptomyces sp. SID2955]